MIKAWLRKRRGTETGVLVAIFVADSAGAPMHERRQALALVDKGLAGDRYAEGQGFWRLTDGCQVTLVNAEDLRHAERRHRLELSRGQHRRNLVISGLAGIDLRGKGLRIGDALFEWHRVRPPCGYLDQVSGRGTAKALGRRAGQCLRVCEGGLISVGDSVKLVRRDNPEPAGPDAAIPKTSGTTASHV